MVGCQTGYTEVGGTCYINDGGTSLDVTTYTSTNIMITSILNGVGFCEVDSTTRMYTKLYTFTDPALSSRIFYAAGNRQAKCLNGTQSLSTTQYYGGSGLPYYVGDVKVYIPRASLPGVSNYALLKLSSDNLYHNVLKAAYSSYSIYNDPYNY
jgi:hypothetical protein